MPSTNLEIAKTAIDDFKEIQEYMLVAKENEYLFNVLQTCY